MANELIKYQDLDNKLSEHTCFLVVNGSKEQLLNRWLNPIRSYAREESNFYGFSDKRDCGWYIEKEEVLEMVQKNIPKECKKEWMKEFELILNKLKDYIVNYKEPK